MYAAGQQEVELVDMSYQTLTDKNTYEGIQPGEVGCSRYAFELLSVEDPKQHHCMMGLATSPDGTFIDMPESFPDGDNGLWKFLSENPQIAYNNLVIDQAESHTFLKNVEIGNLDFSARRYVMNVSVLQGTESLKNTQIVLQSTDQECMFTYKMIMDGKTTEYTFPPTTLPDHYYGVMNFALLMPEYENVNAVIHVENFAVKKKDDEMDTQAVIAYSSRTREPEEAAMLGDFYIHLGKYQETESVNKVYRRKMEGKRQIIVR